MVSFAEQQNELKELVSKVGFTAHWRYLTSEIAFSYAILEEKKKKDSKIDEWLAIAIILESRGK